MLLAISDDTTNASAIGVLMGAGHKYARRHAAYYREAGQMLGLIEARRWALTASGRALVLAKPSSDDETTILREAIAGARELGFLVDAVLSPDAPDWAALVTRAAPQLPDLSISTVRRRVGDVLAWRRWIAPRATTPGARRTRSQEQPEAVPQPASGDEIDASGHEWPDPEHLPFNWPMGGYAVSSVVLRDLRSSASALIVAGFGSLKQICEFVASVDSVNIEKLRVVFGAEPFEGRHARRLAVTGTLEKEVADYWLGRGFSIRHMADVLGAIAAIRLGRVESRVSAAALRLHAKMYVADRAITVGSSNFTEPGMARQLEANVRLTSDDRNSSHYMQARSLAETYWKLGRPYDEELVALLEQLLRKVTWREALARACAELLERDWARQYFRDELGERDQLWPTQLQGVGQALYVLMEVGSVLFADATGSGKTKTGAWLLRALRERLVATGRPIADPVLVAPPAVVESWAEELHAAEVRVEPFSHGSLSSSRAGDRPRIVRAIETARILALDEAHNFINPSRRTALANTNLADHVLLFTATPINRDVSDLLGIVDLLGADNLDDDTLRILAESGGRRGRALTDEERRRLRRAASAFTVRRTKTMLNARIDLDPTHFRNKLNQMCRYPRVTPRYYELSESKQDCLLATEIAELSRQLRGVLWLRKPIRLPERTTDENAPDPKSYVRLRLRGMAALTRYYIRATLRSSRAAAWEHLHGTDAACKRFRIRGVDKQPVGDRIGQLRALQSQAPPEHDTCVPVPDWLTNPVEYRKACAQELATYLRIAACVERLSDGREREKARHLIRLLDEHEQVVAFDFRPITLHLLRDLIVRDEKVHVLIATGGKRAERRAVQHAFGLGARTKNVIALCSNAMAEGINLQQASAVVHLDMPSVVRVAEQRVGRIDRMDSPHDEIESWWPRDASEFALSADERLGARLELVGDLLGSNVSLPEEPANPDEVLPPETVIEELKQQEKLQLELDDAFAPVRAFVEEGDGQLVDAETYNALRRSEAKVLSAVALVRARRPWGFFAIRGSERNAPRWAFVDGESNKVVTALDEVASSLRDNLSDREDLPDFDQRATRVMNRLLDQLEEGAERLLPRRKQRALSQMRQVLAKYQSRVIQQSSERLAVVTELSALVSDRAIDHDELADAWLAAIRSRWRVLLAAGPKRRRTRLRRLAELTTDLMETPLSDLALQQLRSKVGLAIPVAERVVAAIVGVPD
jgi:hypothetical protein